MAKKYIIWVSDSNTDPLAVQRANELATVLGGGWGGIVISNGTIQDLETELQDLSDNIQNNDDVLIYISDYGQLKPEGPKIYASDGNMLLSDIDNKFSDKTFTHLSIIMTGKKSGVGMENYGQLINAEKPFTLATSMASDELCEPDLFNIAFHLPGPATDWQNIIQGIINELNMLRNLPPETKQHGNHYFYHP